MWYSVFGIRYSVFGIRYSVFGKWYRIQKTSSSHLLAESWSSFKLLLRRKNLSLQKICLVVLRFLWLRRVTLGVGVRRSGARHAKQALHHHLWAGLAVANKRGNALAHVILVELIL